MSTTFSEQATRLGRRPDWWLQAAADAITRTHHRIRAGHPATDELAWLAYRIQYLIHLAEHSHSGHPVVRT